MLALTYHLLIQTRLNLSRGALTRVFSKLREPDHKYDLSAGQNRYQAAADHLLGRKFYSGVAAATALKAEVDPVVSEVYEESRGRDRRGEHIPRDINGDNHELRPDE